MNKIQRADQAQKEHTLQLTSHRRGQAKQQRQNLQHKPNRIDAGVWQRLNEKLAHAGHANEGSNHDKCEEKPALHKCTFRWLMARPPRAAY